MKASGIEASNVEGYIEPKQRRFLTLQMLRYVVLTLIPGMLVVLWLWHTPARWFLVVGVIVLAATVIRNYALDILLAKSVTFVGPIHKSKLRVRGPAQYFIAVKNERIRVTKKVWQELEAERPYRIDYAPHSRWLLAYHEDNEDHAL